MSMCMYAEALPRKQGMEFTFLQLPMFALHPEMLSRIFLQPIFVHLSVHSYMWCTRDSRSVIMQVQTDTAHHTPKTTNHNLTTFTSSFLLSLTFTALLPTFPLLPTIMQVSLTLLLPCARDTQVSKKYTGISAFIGHFMIGMLVFQLQRIFISSL